MTLSVQAIGQKANEGQQFELSYSEIATGTPSLEGDWASDNGSNLPEHTYHFIKSGPHSYIGTLVGSKTYGGGCYYGKTVFEITEKDGKFSGKYYNYGHDYSKPNGEGCFPNGSEDITGELFFQDLAGIGTYSDVPISRRYWHFKPSNFGNAFDAVSPCYVKRLNGESNSVCSPEEPTTQGAAKAVLLVSLRPVLNSLPDGTFKVTAIVHEDNWQMDSQISPDSKAQCEEDRAFVIDLLKSWSVILDSDQRIELKTQGWTNVPVIEPFANLKKLSRPNVVLRVEATRHSGSATAVSVDQGP